MQFPGPHLDPIRPAGRPFLWAVRQIKTACAPGPAATTLILLPTKSIRAEGLVRRLQTWLPEVRRVRAETGGRQMLELLVQYLLVGAREEVDARELQDVLSHAVGSEAEELVMNTGEKLIQQGRESGRREGRQEGMQDGLREALESVLRSRFGAVPEEAVARMKSADLETLQRWLDRAIVVESLDQAFGDS